MPRKWQALVPLFAVCFFVIWCWGRGWLGLGAVRAFIAAAGVAKMLGRKTEI